MESVLFEGRSLFLYVSTLFHFGYGVWKFASAGLHYQSSGLQDLC